MQNIFFTDLHVPTLFFLDRYRKQTINFFRPQWYISIYLYLLVTVANILNFTSCLSKFISKLNHYSLRVTLEIFIWIFDTFDNWNKEWFYTIFEGDLSVMICWIFILQIVLKNIFWAKDFHKMFWLLLVAVRINGVRIEHHWHLCCHTYIVNIFFNITSHSGRLWFFVLSCTSYWLITRLMQGGRFLGY